MTILADKVLKTTVEYIGPAAQRFLERQTEKHLAGLRFDDIEYKHLLELAKWVNISAALLIDSARANELAQKISKM